MEPYATHLAPLVRYALQSEGPILELGCGDYSTPVLAEIAKHKGNGFYVMCGDKAWTDKFKHLATILHCSDWENPHFPIRARGPWGLVLLDHEQKTHARIRHLPRLAEIAKVVVVHDADACMAHAHWPEMIKPYRDIEMHKTYRPWTAVLFT